MQGVLLERKPEQKLRVAIHEGTGTSQSEPG